MKKLFKAHFRVYIEDTDAGGVVYYVNYLKYMERARSDFFRDIGFAKVALLDETYLFVVKSCEVEYKQPCFLDDILAVTAEIERVGGSSVQFIQNIFRNNQLVTTARVVVVCVDKQSLKPTRIPKALKNKLK